MRFRISAYEPPDDIRTIWEDQNEDRIENHLRGIATELIVAGESFYRAREVRHREWLIERKEDLEEEDRQRLLEEERKARERRIRLEKQRVDHLLGQATALRQAEEIRTYVGAVRLANMASLQPVPPEEFRDWSEWALAQADRIDPVKSGAFRIRPDEN